MQLVQMDVSSPATNARQMVGPLSSGLNAIYGPQGSGKSRLVRWLRQVTADTYGADYVPNSIGNVDLVGDVVVSNHGQQMRLARDAYGRVTVAPVAHGFPNDNGTYSTTYRSAASGRHQGLTARQRHAFALLADTSQSADSEVVLDDVALRLGLESRHDDSRIIEREQLVARERDLVTRLDLLQQLPLSREELITRRRDVEFKLNSMRQHWDRQTNDGHLDRSRLLDRFAAIEADLQGAEGQIGQLDSEIATAQAELKHTEIGQQMVDVEPSYRQQLQQLEDRLTRWRKTLRDLKAHRESIEQDETEAELDHQVGTQLSGSLNSDPRAPIRSLEAQLHHARKQLDQLIYQYGSGTTTSSFAVSTNDPRVDRDAYGRTHVSYDAAATTGIATAQMPEMLRSMQRDLHDICQQLSRREAATTAAALKQQAQQLRRCETELLHSVEKLIEERGVLLRKIADRYNLTSEQISLTFGDWCQCHDHPHLYDWLLQEEAPKTVTREGERDVRSRLEASLARLYSQRREASLRAEECRRQLRDANRFRTSSPTRPAPDHRQTEEAELLREFDLLTRQLADLESRDRLVMELDEVRRLLGRIPAFATTNSEYRTAVDRHVVGLCGALIHRLPLRNAEMATNRHYDTINGVVTEQPAYRQRFEVPSAIARTAQRLAIGQLLASRGDAVPVVLDQTLDGLDANLQHAAVAHLAQTSQRFQVVLLSADSHIADLVRQHRGQVISLQNMPIAPAPVDRLDRDINRQLTGFANDEETAKWYQPNFDPLPRNSIREFYLNENSTIELHPGIDAETGLRCRKLGVVNIGDLLDVDPTWLANGLRSSNIDPARVSIWQSAADLLCNVQHLRPFDARVLVGAGVQSAAQLSAMNPNQLVNKVERFLTTEIGRKILRTGDSFEYSRIRNWITAARGASNGYERTNVSPRNGTARKFYGPDVDRMIVSQDDDRENQARDDQTRNYQSRSNYDERAPQAVQRFDRPERQQRPERPERTERRRERTSRPERIGRAGLAERDFPTVPENGRTRSVESSGARNGSSMPRNSSGGNVAKFYLELASSVVDAPSIGERTAQRLNECGVFTVEQLLAANALALAGRLNLRRVTDETIRVWQDQARLVCRIPFLRGHDAQMLVACGVASPETLRSSSAESILSKVVAYARSVEGQRILRGSKEPDLDEVHDWIKWANQSRALNAA